MSDADGANTAGRTEDWVRYEWQEEKFRSPRITLNNIENQKIKNLNKTKQKAEIGNIELLKNEYYV